MQLISYFLVDKMTSLCNQDLKLVFSYSEVNNNTEDLDNCEINVLFRVPIKFLLCFCQRKRGRVGTLSLSMDDT